jgi:hypothetical protein
MNPKPLLALNHFTVPCSLLTALLFSVSRYAAERYLNYALMFLMPCRRFATDASRTPLKEFVVSLPGIKNGRKFEPCDRFTIPKAIQEQQTQKQNTTGWARIQRFF